MAICLGREPPDAAAAQDYRNNIEELVAAHPGQVGLITVVRDASTPTPDGRAAVTTMFRELWPHLSCVAFVLEGSGFAAAAQRGILSGILLATGLGNRMKIFSDVEDATDWMAPHLVPSPAGTDPSLLAPTLADVVHTFCERYSHPHF